MDGDFKVALFLRLSDQRGKYANRYFKKIVMIAAWLHDIASITDYSLYEQHHIHGAKMAYSILKEYSYDEQFSLIKGELTS